MTASRTTRQVLAMDLNRHHRRLELTAHFGPQPPQEITPSEEHPHGNLISPNYQQLPELMSEDGTTLTNLKYPKSTLTPTPTPESPSSPPEEELALEELRKNQEIIIKPADKGRAIVVMARRDSVSEALRQLHHKEHFIQLTTDVQENSGKDHNRTGRPV